jgi:hypothetical protein
MIKVYGNYGLTFSITSTHGNAAFTAPAGGVGLVSGRSGAGQGFTWDAGAQNTSTTVTLTATINTSMAFENPASIGGVGVFNVQGLPAGTKFVVNGVTQRLTAGERGELNAIWLPQISGNSFTITMYNDVNGSASIASAAPFYIGQVYAGRAIGLRSLLDGTGLLSQIYDPTAFNRSGGLQLYQLMRKNVRQYAGDIGRFTTTDAKGGSASTIYNGNLSTGVTDIQSLRSYLSTSPLCMVCDTPYAGFTSRPAPQGPGALYYAQQFMQSNFVLARMTAAGDLILDNAPYWTWKNVQYQEAT